MPSVLGGGGADRPQVADGVTPAASCGRSASAQGGDLDLLDEVGGGDRYSARPAGQPALLKRHRVVGHVLALRSELLVGSLGPAE